MFLKTDIVYWRCNKPSSVISSSNEYSLSEKLGSTVPPATSGAGSPTTIVLHTNKKKLYHWLSGIKLIEVLCFLTIPNSVSMQFNKNLTLANCQKNCILLETLNWHLVKRSSAIIFLLMPIGKTVGKHRPHFKWSKKRIWAKVRHSCCNSARR